MRPAIVVLITVGLMVHAPYSTNAEQIHVKKVAPAIEEPETHLAPARLTIANVVIDVTFAQGQLTTPRVALSDWITTAARAVAHYYGQFPVSRLRILLMPESNSAGVRFGTTFGGDLPLIKIWIGELTDATMLQQDWVLTHEMVHLAFPQVPQTHHWLEEGLATYIEPLARFGVGQLREEKVWKDLVGGLPHGLPQSGDKGLDYTPTWGRTYWGGALFCLLADLEIRQRTKNRYGLQDALRAIVTVGGTIQVSWSVTRALAVGDQAIGAPVLTELYDHMKATPVPVDLEGLWRRLGVEKQGNTITFRDDAPLTAVRQAITMAARGNLVISTNKEGGHYE